MKIGRASFSLCQFQEQLEWDEWLPISHNNFLTGELRVCFKLEREPQIREEFDLLLNSFSLDNNWVFIDPKLDCFDIKDSIVPISEPKEERKREGEVPKLREEPTRGEFYEITEELDEDLRLFLLREKEEGEQQFQELMAQQYRCQLCQVISNPDSFFDLDCGHNFCQQCVQLHTLQTLENPNSLEVPCPSLDGCSSTLPQYVLRVRLSVLPSTTVSPSAQEVLKEKVLDEFLLRYTLKTIDNSEDFIRCPNSSCNSVIERLEGEMDASYVVRLFICYFPA